MAKRRTINTDKHSSLQAIKKVTPDSLRNVYRAAIEAGCTVSLSGGGHVRVSTPTGGLVFGAHSASDVRASRNLRTDLRRNHVAV